MMQLMRYISELYYDNSKTVLNVVGIVLSVLLLIEIIRCLYNKEKYVLNDWLQYIIVSVYVCIAGQILVLFKISVLDINSVDKILFFLIVFVCIVIYVAAQLIIYKKLGVAISQMFKCFSYLVYAVYFCLSVTKTLDFLEWYDGVLLLLCCETLARWIGYVVRKKVGANDENVKAVKSDHSNSDLYHDRKKQLDKFLLDLEDMKKEPYGIMISGEWGSGKSSFIKALKERLTEDCFIEIQAGSEKSIAEIMRELSSEIFDILRKNNVFVEDYSVIDEYFSAFSTLAEQAETGYIKSIFRRKNRNPIDEKSYLNEKLKELKKTIYIVIDDLDRCEDEHQDKTFKVIRECTELEHCKTIFLVDKNEFLKKYQNTDYLEKYFSDSINLVKIGYDEIFDKHRYLYSMTEDDLMFAYEMPHQIVKELEDIIKIKQDAASGEKSDEEKVIGEQIVELQQSVLTISNNMCNSRKVKQYFKGVEKDFKTLEFQKDLFQSELKDANWKEKIVRIHFLKRFFPQSYHDIEIQSRIQDCAESYNSSVAALILGNGFLFSFPDEKDIIMINEIIYHWDAVDWRRISTEREGYEERLAKNTIQEGDIEKYILYAKDFNAMEKILNLYETNNKTDGERKVFFDFYFSQITRLLESRIFDVTEALAFYNKFVWCLGQINLSKREQKLYGEKGKLVADTIIRQNVSVFSDIILLTKGVTFIKDKWQLVSDLNTLYANLYRLDGDYFRSNTADDDTFNKVRRYYTDIGKVFMAEHAEGDVKKFEGLFVDVQAVLLLYDGWSNLDRNYLGYNYKKADAFKKYFTFENSYTYKSDVFSSVDALKDAYVTYLTFLKSIKTEEYTCAYEELFVRVLAETVYRAESDKAWFGDNYLYVCSAAQVIIDELARFKEHDKAAMNKIEIYFYRLNYMA